MCLICVDLIKQRLTITEATKNAGEMMRADDEDTDHITELWFALKEMDDDKIAEIIESGNNKKI